MLSLIAVLTLVPTLDINRGQYAPQDIGIAVGIGGTFPPAFALHSHLFGQLRDNNLLFRLDVAGDGDPGWVTGAGTSALLNADICLGYVTDIDVIELYGMLGPAGGVAVGRAGTNFTFVPVLGGAAGIGATYHPIPSLTVLAEVRVVVETTVPEVAPLGAGSFSLGVAYHY